MRPVKVIWKSLAGFFRDDCLTLAAAMSYFTMMALVPFCLFLITLFGHILGRDPEFHNFLLGRVVSLFPSVTGHLSQDLMKLISFKGLGKYSLLLYGLLSFQVFASLENSMNVIFKTGKRRHMVVSVLMALLVVTFIMVVAVASFMASTVMPFMTQPASYVPWIKVGRLTAFMIRYVIPFVMMLAILTAVYLLLPVTRVRVSNALKGAFFTTVFFEAAKHVFTWYVVSIAQMGRIYGPLTAFIVFLLWLFYSSCLVLLGAEIVYNLGITPKSGGKK